MPEEKKTVELKDEELKQVTGGAGCKCGNTITMGQCQQYDSSNPQCSSCLGRPLEQGDIPVLEQPATR